MSTAEAKLALGCSLSTIQRRIRSGHFTHITHGGNYFVRRDEVTKSAAGPRSTGASEPPAVWVEQRFQLATELLRRRLELGVDDEVPPMLRLTEVAQGLGVDVRRIRTSVDEGVIPSSRFGSRSLVASTVVIEILGGGPVAA
jgi:predicted site-specific integrase-resolvase